MVELYIVNCDKHQGIKFLCVFFDVEIFVFLTPEIDRVCFPCVDKEMPHLLGGACRLHAINFQMYICVI